MSNGFCDFTSPLGTSQELDLAIRSFKIVSNCEVWGRNNFQNLGAAILELSYKLILIFLIVVWVLRWVMGILQSVIHCLYLALTYL